VKRILKQVDNYLRFFENVSVVLLLSVASILAFLEVVLRYAFSASITWSSEVVVLCIIWAIFIGLSVTLSQGAHIKVEVIVNLFSGNKKLAIVLLSTLIGVAFAVFLFFYSVEYAAFLKESEERSITTNIPEYIYFLALPLGGLLLSIRYIQELVRVIRERGNKNKKLPIESKAILKTRD